MAGDSTSRSKIDMESRFETQNEILTSVLNTSNYYI